MGNKLVNYTPVDNREVITEDDVSVYSLNYDKMKDIYGDYISLTEARFPGDEETKENAVKFSETERKPVILKGRMVLPRSHDLYGRSWVVGVKDLMMYRHPDCIMDSYEFVSDKTASISYRPKDSS